MLNGLKFSVKNPEQSDKSYFLQMFLTEANFVRLT